MSENATGSEQETCVWISTSLNNVNDVQAVLRKEYGDDWRLNQSPEMVEWSRRMVRESALGWKRGEILTKEQVGDIWYYNNTVGFQPPPFMSGGGYPLVSETLKSVLEKFDLGECVFHPLKIMSPDEKQLTTPEPYYFLNVGNKRSMGNYEMLGPEGEINAPLDCRGGGIRYLPSIGQESKLVVVPEALCGPDIWLDPKVPSLLFLSDTLVTGLRGVGMEKGWGLVRVSVGTL